MSFENGSAGPRLRVFEAEQCQAIHQAALDVLLGTGYALPRGEARELLHEAGARVEGERVYISPKMVEGALESMRVAALYDRLGQPSPVLKRGHVAFGGLVDTFFVRDLQTQEIRPFLKNDQRWMAALHDALPNIEWIQVVGQSNDVPNELQTQTAYLETVLRTTKPILVYPYDKQGLLDVLEIAAAIAGSDRAYREKPFVFCASVPAAPLAGTDHNLELLLSCAEHEVPLLYYSCPAVGGNSPSSLVGCIILATADWLAALVMHQLKRPGAPVCTFGFTVQLMEMRSLIWAYNAPEMHLAYGAVADLAHWYGLPAWGIVLESDYPLLNAQAGVEMSADALWAMLSGLELVHNTGRSGAGKLVSAEAAVLADEIISYTRAAVQPLAVSKRVIQESLDLIDEKGPLGEYVTHEHTLSHFRDFWYPTIFDRSHFDPRQDGLGSGWEERLSARAKDLIDGQLPVSPPAETLARLKALEQGWYARSN